jgi:hypothetical protein
MRKDEESVRHEVVGRRKSPRDVRTQKFYVVRSQPEQEAPVIEVSNIDGKRLKTLSPTSQTRHNNSQNIRFIYAENTSPHPHPPPAYSQVNSSFYGSEKIEASIPFAL